MRFEFSQARFVDREINPGRIAVAGSDAVLTWGELADASDRWMLEASELGAARDVPLVIIGHKQAHFIVAITGCLRMGIPFVPMDTIYPAERIRRICDIAKCSLVFHADTGRFERLDRDPQPLSEKSLAYVMFTSGSTGEPKGVQIGLESVTGLAAWMQSSFALGDYPVFMNQAPFSFDLSIYEVVGTLHFGGTCVLNSREIIADAPSFYERMRHYQVTVWVSTPSFAYQQLLSKDFNQIGLSSLKTFLFCGEVLPNSLARHIRERFPDSNIINTYGPTEATVATTWVFIDDEVVRAYDPLPVGYQKPDSRIWCDPVTDELCISGKNVMRGYLNRDDLNATKLFYKDGQRGFRTGDIGRIDSDGLIFCSGRMDDQIKLNGYRIELSEVDAALRKLPGILNGATIAIRKPDNTVMRLVSFVTLLQGDRLWLDSDGLEWKNQLARHLPVYMIPSEILACETLPVSANDKVDRKKLAGMYAERAKALRHK